MSRWGFVGVKVFQREFANENEIGTTSEAVDYVFSNEFAGLNGTNDLTSLSSNTQNIYFKNVTTAGSDVSFIDNYKIKVNVPGAYRVSIDLCVYALQTGGPERSVSLEFVDSTGVAKISIATHISIENSSTSYSMLHLNRICNLNSSTYTIRAKSLATGNAVITSQDKTNSFFVWRIK